MTNPDLLRPFAARQLGLTEGDDRVVVFGVLGGRRLGPTILVHSPTLLHCLDQLDDEVEVVVFVEDVSTDPATVATIDEMLATMGSEDGLVQFHVAAEAIKLTREHESSGRAPGPPPKEGRAPGPEVVVSHGIDRSTLVSFRPPEVLRTSALVAAVTKPPSELWVNPAGLVAANGGRIETYPRTPSPA